MPDALELPGVLRAIVPLMCAGDSVVHKFIPDWLPGRAAVVGSLDQLPEPAAGLRGIQPIRVGRRTFDMVDLPAPKMRATDLPLFALGIRCQDECALACTNQYPYLRHCVLLSCPQPIDGGMHHN